MSPDTVLETIDYDAVAADYREGLLNRLRGFQGGQGFLEAWVDQEDPVEALFSLFDVARGHGLPGLVVRVGAVRAAAIDRSRLAAALAALGEVTVVEDDGVSVLTRFGAPAVPAGRVQRAASTVARIDHGAPSATGSPELAVSWTIGASHAAAATARARDVRHEGPLVGEATVGAIRCASTMLGVTLDVDVDAASGRVLVARFRGAPGDAVRGLLEALCAQAEAAPLRELVDHGVLRVEHALRAEKPVSGIVLPDNAGPAFAAAQRLVRGLLETDGLSLEDENRFDPGVGRAWSSLPAEAQREAIAHALEGLLAERGLPERSVACCRVVDGERVVLVFEDSVSAGERPRLLMRLEEALQRAVDPGLYVLTEEKKDANRLRRL